MGQYYAPCFKAKGQKVYRSIYTHEFGDGLKLMEHSWLGNEMVGAMARLIINNPMRIVWAGDYADKEKGKVGNLYSISKAVSKDEFLSYIKENGVEVDGGVWLSEKGGGYRIDYKLYPFLVDHTLKEYVDLRELPVDNGWIIHPLPLLTSEGNGQGGGDYYGHNQSLCGRWARHQISLEEDVPEKYKELKPKFQE